MATVLIGGGSGLLGMRLSRLLRDGGHQVLHLSRRRRPDAEFPTYQWDVGAGQVDEEAIRRADVVINLAGAGIADGRWTESRKRLIIDSRVDSARLLRQAFERLGHRPRAYLSAAAIGYYGNRGDEWLSETSGPGAGFLPESCLAWEAAAEEIAASGIRTVILRLGIILSTRDGALPKMSLPVHFFIAPYFGDGRQWYSWIHIDDACRAFLHVMDADALAGAYNVVAPNPVRNRDFIDIVARAMNKPALPFPAPAFALKVGLGEMAHTVLDSNRVSADKLRHAGFGFRFPELRPALDDLFRRKV